MVQTIRQRPGGMSDLRLGCAYFFQGIREFYRTRSLWKYAILPFFVIVLIYGAGCWLAFCKVLPVCLEKTQFYSVLPDWLQWLQTVWNILMRIGVSFFIFRFIIAVASCAYEMLDALFFDRLVFAYERLNGIPTRRMSVQERIDDALSGIFYALGSLLLYCLLAACGWITFFIGIFTGVFLFVSKAFDLSQYLILGYRYAVSSMVNSADNAGIGRDELRRLAAKRKMLVIGFGATAYFLQLINIFTLPGIELGGSMMFRKEILPGCDDGAPAAPAPLNIQRMENRQFIN